MRASSRFFLPGLVLLVLLTLGLVPRASAQEDIASQLIERINQARAAANLPPLMRNPLLDAAAQGHANDILQHGSRLGHRGSDGSTFRQRIARAGFTGPPVGENWAGYRSLDVTMTFWMNDAPHARNILNPKYAEIGIGVAQRSRGGYVVVTDFGGRMEPLAPPVQLAQAAPPTAAPTEPPPPTLEPGPTEPPPPTPVPPQPPTPVPTTIPTEPPPPTQVAIVVPPPPPEMPALPLRVRGKVQRISLQGNARATVSPFKPRMDFARMYWGGVLSMTGAVLLGVAVVGHRRRFRRWRSRS